MALPSITEIIAARAPQYSNDVRIETLIAIATEQTGQEFGGLYDLAIALRVLHWMTQEASDGGTAENTGVGNGGSITSETEGSLSRSYGGASSSAVIVEKYPDLASTKYGLELIALQKACVFGARTRMM